MRLSAGGGGYIAAFAQRNGALADACRLVLVAVEVLEAHDSLNRGAVQDKPSLVPPLQKK